MKRSTVTMTLCFGLALSGCAEETFFVGSQRCSMDPRMSYDFGVPPEPYRAARSVCDPARQDIIARRAAIGLGVAANGPAPSD